MPLSGSLLLNRLSLPSLQYNLQTLRGDILGGITAAVVSLPVALAFGLAAGLSPAAGVYGAISVGFFAAVFGGTRGLISGPTGSMTVVMAVIVASHACRARSFPRPETKEEDFGQLRPDYQLYTKVTTSAV